MLHFPKFFAKLLLSTEYGITNTVKFSWIIVLLNQSNLYIGVLIYSETETTISMSRRF